MKTIMEMARECDLIAGNAEHGIYIMALERFAELVREDERNRTWTQEHWTEYERNIAAAEREACAGECDEWIKNGSALAEDIAAAIRARGQA